MRKKSSLMSVSGGKLLWWTNGKAEPEGQLPDIGIQIQADERPDKNLEIGKLKPCQVSTFLQDSGRNEDAPNTREDDLKIRSRLSSTLRRLRTKSCDRILKRARQRSGRLTPPNIVHAPMDEEYFRINSTLRRSRRNESESFLRQRRHDGGYVGIATAKVDCVPSPYDIEALPFKSGDTIRIIRRCPSGIWVGDCGGRTGNFKFINVEEVEDVNVGVSELRTIEDTNIPDLLASLELPHLTSRLVLNGWDNLHVLPRLARRDLEYLGINDPGEQDRLLSATSVLKRDVKEDASDHLEVRNRHLTRMDSGYYDGLREGSSDGSSSQDSLHSSSTEGGQENVSSDDLSGQNELSSTTPPSSRTMPLVPHPAITTEGGSTANHVHLRPVRPKKSRGCGKLKTNYSDPSIHSIEFCHKFAETLKFFESGPSAKNERESVIENPGETVINVPEVTAVTAVAKRSTVYLEEPRLSVAEPTFLNKSF